MAKKVTTSQLADFADEFMINIQPVIRNLNDGATERVTAEIEKNGGEKFAMQATGWLTGEYEEAQDKAARKSPLALLRATTQLVESGTLNLTNLFAQAILNDGAQTEAQLASYMPAASRTAAVSAAFTKAGAPALAKLAAYQAPQPGAPAP